MNIFIISIIIWSFVICNFKRPLFFIKISIRILPFLIIILVIPTMIIGPKLTNAEGIISKGQAQIHAGKKELNQIHVMVIDIVDYWDFFKIEEGKKKLASGEKELREGKNKYRKWKFIYDFLTLSMKLLIYLLILGFLFRWLFVKESFRKIVRKINFEYDCESIRKEPHQ